ncbi:unnamed protein product [Cuscuta campestris]|uniref:J domain-containing protein n=1 Tax=Cuscuta campestris TaxID=132261 RepID=A0A484NFD6_9ASTE|nr:unnamed protein product [Cuscuta campestris]
MEGGEGEKRRNGEEEDLYGVLGLNKECSVAELRSAYKKLALKWHPDRCSGRGNSKSVEEAKKKFQAIQQAYSVLSDTNKRFLYDVGVYDFDDEDDENGMGDFLDEMAAMMNDMKSSEKPEGESFEELQVMFEEMFQSSATSFFVETKSFPSSSASSCNSNTSSFFKNSNHNVSNKRSSSDFCIGTGGGWTRQEGREARSGRKKHGRK